MMRTFEKFSRATGFKVNPIKCHIYFAGVDKEMKDEIIKVTSFREGALPSRYLSIPITGSRLAVRDYDQLIDKNL